METYKDYMLFDKLPHTWCAGCGHGIILQAIADSFAMLKMDKHRLALVSGIGCFGRVDDYLDINCMHVTHGRAIGAAAGVALGNPELNVIVTMGDGDGATIGGNHLIHAARRNVNLTAIVANNYNYGQTGGQYSGTTPTGSITATSPYGHLEPPFDLCRLAAAAGAPFVARSTVANPVQIRQLICEGIKTRGFALIEIMDPCPTHWGRLNKKGTAGAMIRELKACSVTAAQAAKMSPEERAGKFITGRIVKEERPDYYTLYKNMIDQQTARGENK